MRPKNRINRICNKLAEIWLKSPDQRFYQLLINEGIIQDDSRLWNLEDDKLESFLDKMIKKVK